MKTYSTKLANKQSNHSSNVKHNGHLPTAGGTKTKDTHPQLNAPYQQNDHIDKGMTPQSSQRNLRKMVGKLSSGHQAPKLLDAANAELGKVRPMLRSIDTIEMDADLTAQEVERAIVHLKLMVNEKRAKRITSKNKFWSYVFSVPLGDAHQGYRGVSVTYYFQSTAKNSSVPMRMQFNASLIKEEHMKSFLSMFKTVFPTNAKQVAHCLRFHGIDEACDRKGEIDDFILERARTTTASRYFIQTDRGGKIQTAYTGSASSPSHGVVYDMDCANDFRRALAEFNVHRDESGQPVPLNGVTAEHTFDSQPAGLVRVESRRVFKEQPLTLKQVLALPSAFSEYQFFDLTQLSAKDKKDPAFQGFLDSVRLRGVHGACKRLEDVLGGGRAAKREVAEFERRLGKSACPWWSAIDHRQQLGALLRASPVWRFLKHTGRSHPQ